MKQIFKKNPVEYKQPQEYYCSNYECLNEVAAISDWFYHLDKDSIKYSSHYCIDCIIEGKTE